MTSEEIRKRKITVVSELDGLLQVAIQCREIAAQLAELNEHLEAVGEGAKQLLRRDV